MVGERGITLSGLLAKLTQGDVLQTSVTIVEGSTFAQLREALAQVTPESRTDSLEVKEEVRKALKRYFAKNLTQKKLVWLGQLASVGAVLIGFVFSLSFTNIVTAWEMMVFVVVTVILVRLGALIWKS